MTLIIPEEPKKPDLPPQAPQGNRKFRRMLASRQKHVDQFSKEYRQASIKAIQENEHRMAVKRKIEKQKAKKLARLNKKPQ